jgi:hypothetical protein
MFSTIRGFQQQQPNNFSMSPQLNQQYQSIFNQCINLKKEYDSTTDEDLKNALRVVLNKKIEQLQGLTASYTSTINVQLQTITPQ